MGTRRKSREFALQILYAADLLHASFDTIIRTFWLDRTPGESVRSYAEHIAAGVLNDRPRIDALIESKSRNWRISRMSIVDRNILRSAVYELLTSDVPPAVIINEAIEIAKRYGDGESGQFVNGVLDAVHHALPGSGS